MPHEHVSFILKEGENLHFWFHILANADIFGPHSSNNAMNLVFLEVPKISLFGNIGPADLITQIAFKVDFWINMLLPWWIFKGELCWQVCTATNSLQTRLFCQIDLIDVVGGSQNTTVWPDALWWSQMRNVPPLSPKFYTCDMTHHTLELDWDYLAKGLLINL